MVSFQPEKIVTMFKELASRHKGEIYRMYLDWEIQEISNPRYGNEKYQQLLPLVVIEFK